MQYRVHLSRALTRPSSDVTIAPSCVRMTRIGPKILLLGAEFTRLYAQRERGTPAPEPYAKKDPKAPEKATKGDSR